MLFLVDESTGKAVVRHLRHLGYDVLAAGEIMPQADDPHVLSLALQEKRILITNDKDFGELVYRSGQGHHGVLLLRLQDESQGNRVRVTTAVLEQCGERLAGCFTVATETTIRVRPAFDPF